MRHQTMSAPLLLPIAGFVLPAIATRIEHMARQTSPAERYDQALAQRAPEATAAPQPRWGAMGMDSLFDRAVAGTDTCGYISGSGTLGFYPLTCGAGYTCTNSGAYRGCCVGTSGCSAKTNFFTTCMDSTASACSAATVGPNTLCCTYSSQYPYCITYLWSTSALPGSAYTEYNCDASRFSGVYFLSADTPTATSASITSTSISSSSQSQTSTISSASSSSSSAVPSPTPDPQPSTPIGAIVGGVVGGVAVLAIIGFLIWFFIRRNKKADVAVAQPTPQMEQPGGYPSPPPPGPPGYDPRYSYAATAGPISPTTGGYPSPAGSPAPFMNNPAGMGIYNQQSGHDSWMQPQHTGASTMKDSSPHSPVYVHEATRNISEVDAVNPIGKGGSHAELA